LEILDSQVNIFILGAILLLAIIDIIFKKNLKSQIVSLGVLGTFIGIFIGLQDFNPEDMRNSINSILFGLKTAFFTSIVGMGTALVLSTIQKIFSKKIDNSTQESLLLEISKKLDKLEKIESSNDTDRVVFELKQLQKVQINTQNETVKIYNEIQKSSKSEKILLEIYKKLDSTQDTDKIIKELQQLRMVQTDTRDKSVKIYRSIDELRANSNRENQKLIEILDSNFSKMNNSLEIAIDKLSKGATEEIIKALEHVIKEFNNELQNSFGDNFIQLNEAVVNLLEWQSNYKIHIEHIEKHLNISSSSIEKSKESLEVISSKNEAIIDVYKQLKNIINIYYHQIKELNQHLETYSNLSDNAENMFLNITKNISKTTEEFKNLTDVISSSNQEQKESFLSDNKEIKKAHSDLTKHIKDENSNQAKYNSELFHKSSEDFSNLAKTISLSNQNQKESFLSDNKEIKKAHSDLTKHIKSESIKQIEFNKELFTKNKAELDNISKHFNNLGEQIPKALQISLNELNRGLTSLTKEFQKSYKEIMDKYKDGIDNAGR
jgi:acyl carrier protein phosphodiesterase